jgi:hypothetical protein
MSFYEITDQLLADRTLQSLPCRRWCKKYTRQDSSPATTVTLLDATVQQNKAKSSDRTNLSPLVGVFLPNSAGKALVRFPYVCSPRG